MLRSSLSVGLLVVLAGACAPSASGEEPRTSESEVMAAGFRTADIRAADGAVLKANVIEPETPGLHPAIVFPSSWGLFDAEYVVQAKELANAGYTVLSYSPRGFWASGGEIDTAGPKDVSDARVIIDWLLAETSADPAHIGMAGVSYGAGISLLASAFDDRIKAVAALSGWTDLVASLYADDTRRQQTVALLTLTAEAVGHPSAEFENLIKDFATAQNIPALKTWGAARSVAKYLPALNRNRPAILIANAYGDSIFPPNQLVDFFGAYQGEKRLELRPGDHAIPEAKGLVGLPNDVWAGLRSWMDRYLRGGGAPVANGIELHSQSDGPTEFFADWSSVSHATRRFDLGAPRSFGLDLDTLANGGVALASGALDRLTGVPPLVEVAFVDRLHGAVWEGATGGMKIRGIPKLHFEFAPNRASGTLVSYLYDVDALGIGRLITHAPASWRDTHAGAAQSLDVSLPVTDYDVPEDHHLAVVVDGKDALYIDENELGSQITLRTGSRLELPMASH
jgi:dienelactone hydrolase